MMSHALYVYVSSKFTTDATFEPYGGGEALVGSVGKPRAVTVPPGIYRVTTTTPLPTDRSANASPSYEVGTMGTKSDPPDVPRIAQDKFHKTPADLRGFLSVSGDEAALPPPSNEDDDDVWPDPARPGH